VKLEQASGVKNGADFRLACWFGELLEENNEIAIFSADEAFVELELLGKQRDIPVHMVRGVALEQLESVGSIPLTSLSILNEAKILLGKDDANGLQDLINLHSEPLPLRKLHTGRSVLHLAVHFHSFSCLKLLAPLCDVNLKCDTGTTALMWSARADVQRLLIANAADVNMVDEQGNSALHHVSMRSSERPKDRRLNSQYPVSRTNLRCGLVDAVAFLITHNTFESPYP